jgi:hypothetical protein
VISRADKEGSETETRKLSAKARPREIIPGYLRATMLEISEFDKTGFWQWFEKMGVVSRFKCLIFIVNAPRVYGIQTELQ